MCEYGNTVPVEVWIAPGLSYTKKWRKDVKAVDSCIADIIRALSQGGIMMRTSCCGHGKGDGEIVFQDGRILKIKPRESVEKTEDVE